MRASGLAISLALILLATGLLALPGAAAQNDTTDATTGETFEWSCNVLRCHFSAQNLSTASEDATYVWEFGDNSTLLGQSVDHRYRDPGTYNVTLTVTPGDGAKHTYTKQIDVEADRGDPDAVPWSALGVGLFAFVGSLLVARMT